MPPYDPNDPEEVEKDLRVEREAHEALVGDNGRPCYPIELGFRVFDDPGQYKDLLEYWQAWESGAYQDTERWIFFRQLERWKQFRQFQQKNRRYFVSHSSFPEFQQQVLERRRRHGLDSDIQLLEDQNKQSKLDDWMEYQDYELRKHERLEKDFKEAQALLAFRRQALAEAGISAFEEIQELEFVSYYSLAVQCSGEEGKAEEEEKLAERKLRLAERRLKAAGSDDLGESFERATWVELFLKEVQAKQMRLDELQRVAEDAKRELEPYSQWFQGRQIEWAELRLADPEQGERMIRLECESAEFQELVKKRKELAKKEYEASSKRYGAKKELEFAEEVYKAARLDSLEETVERAALIKVAQEEVQSAQAQFDQAKESREKIELKGKVISALSSIPLTRGKITRHNVLLEWIEQQRREIAGGRADIEKVSGRCQSKGPSLRVLRNYPTIEASRLNKPLKANGRKRKQSKVRSVLSPADPAKISKASSKRRSPRQRISVLCDTSQAAEKMTTDSTAPEFRSKQAFKVKDAMPPSLRPIHPSRVCKPGGKRPAGLRRDSTKLPPTRLKGENNLGRLSSQPTRRKAMQQSANVSLRRSTRITKQPERFRPGYT